MPESRVRSGAEDCSIESWQARTAALELGLPILRPPTRAAPPGARLCGRLALTAGSGPGMGESPSCWLLLMLYPFAHSLGTYPVGMGGGTVSLEFLFSLVCVFTVAVEAAVGRLRLQAGNRCFLLGLALWLAAHVASLLLHDEPGAGEVLFRMLLKAMFGYMVFWVLQASAGLSVALKSYVAGCALSGLLAIAFCVESRDLQSLRVASFTGLDPDASDIDMFRGVARAGASNLLPVWICAVLYPSVANTWKRAALLSMITCFAVTAMLALRREVLVEAVVGLLVLWFAMPRRFRPGVAIIALVLGGVLVGTIALSESWQDRLFGQTRDALEAGSDPRTVLLLNTPAEVMAQPLFGHGPGSYRWLMLKHFIRARQMQERGIAAHNSFSRAAVETGMIGLLGLALMMAALGWRAVRRRSNVGMSGIGAQFAALMIFLHVGDWLSFGDGIISNTTWFFIGSLLYLDRCLLQAESPRHPR